MTLETPMKTTAILLLLASIFSIGPSQTPQAPSPERQQFIRVEAPVIALAHVRVIDGTGAASHDDQTIVIAEGKIQSIGPGTTANVPPTAQVLDLKGYTVLPVLVGMHNHMFFPQRGSSPNYSNITNIYTRSQHAPRVTTRRTTRRHA